MEIDCHQLFGGVEDYVRPHVHFSLLPIVHSREILVTLPVMVVVVLC